MKIQIKTDDPRALMAVLRRERKVRSMSLIGMAESMGAYDVAVQRMEEAADETDPEPYYTFEVERLKAYVEALGGTLSITVELP
jgi:hypothetical protein